MENDHELFSKRPLELAFLPPPSDLSSTSQRHKVFTPALHKYTTYQLTPF